MRLNKTVRAVLPVFNEGARLTNVLNYYVPLLGSIDLVDNSSTDNSLEIARLHPGVTIYSQSNVGTIETTEWFEWLLNKIPSDYYLMLSCSETISPKFIAKISDWISCGYQLVYVHRESRTDNVDTSLVFAPLRVLLGLDKFVHPVCRLFSACSVYGNEILIHDNFNSFKDGYSHLIELSPEYSLLHSRSSDKQALFAKILAYSKVESTLYSRKEAFKVLCRGLTREIAALLIISIRMKSNSIIINELLARIVMHIQIFVLTD